MKVYKGTSRLVIQIGRIVIKIPQLGPYYETFVHWIKNKTQEAGPLYLLIPPRRAFINVQEHIDGDLLTEDEILKVLRGLPKEALSMVRYVDDHAIMGKNWIRRHSDGKVFLIDYGDSFAYRGYPISAVVDKVGFEAAWKAGQDE